MSKVKDSDIASKIYLPKEKQVTYNYTDGTQQTLDLEAEDTCPILVPGNSPILDKKGISEGIDKLTDELVQTQEKRKQEGKCIKCGALLPMTIYGMKDCEKC